MSKEYKPLQEDETKKTGLEDEKRNKLTVEEMVDRTIDANKENKLSLVKFIALYMVGLLSSMVGPMMAYSPIFTGFLNYKDWVCISEKCEGVLANNTGDSEKLFSRDTICENSLQPEVDFTWTIDRTSYALEWGLICSNESKGSNLKSFFFVGAFIGLLVGTALFDRIGRKTTSLIGISIATLSCLGVILVDSYGGMLALRIAQGFGSFITVSGVGILALELTPSKLRNLSQVLCSSLWNIGSILCVGISYAVKDWKHIYLVEGCILAVTAISVLVYPESPRFQLVKGKESEARETFRKISRIFKTSNRSENVELIFKDYDKNYLGQIRDFIKYPVMLKNTLILMACWGSISCISYGLLFSWGKLGADIYSSIIFSSLGSFISKASGIDYYIIHFLGRKNAVVLNFAGLAALFFLAVPCYGVELGDTWRLEHVVCLFTTLFSGGVWGSISLLTKELSPTSHRGMILCICSATARIGAFIGPYLSLLYNIIDSRIVLAIFGCLGACASFLAFFNSDSTGKPIPAVPEDLIPLHSSGHEKLREEESQ
ncbi:hypothetical protein ACHWQZ_G016287 [Mnemiopsis leidyi]